MDYLKAAVAMLICGKEQGTAFLVSNTLALTMTHCVTDAIENGEDIILAFKNIPGQDEINIKASIVPYEEDYPVSVLRIDNEIPTEPLGISCCEDHIRKKEELMAYGYPHVKGQEGYPIDTFINDYLSENVINEGDVTLVIDPKIRLENYSGMSGSPVVYRNNVIGILIEQGIESIGNNQKAVDVKMVSIKRIQKLLDNAGILYSSIKYAEMQDEISKLQQPKSYHEGNCFYNEQKKNYKENYAASYCELDSAIEDYEKSIESQLKSICSIKNKGNIKKAWDELRNLTTMVRGSKSKPSKILSRLYYLQACWYIDDYEDSGNAQKYIKKALEITPDYDCRNYNAKKLFLEGNVVEVKKVLYPIDSTSILNTYIQLCVYNREIEDAYEVFENKKDLANDGTYYLMSLICILDGDYALARQYMEKANKETKDIPLHIMMEGVIMYWELLPSNMIYGDSVLPSLYVNSMLLLNNESKQKLNEIVSLYQKAYDLAEKAENMELQKQILVVWLNTLSISDEYREEGYKIAFKLMELEPYECQAVIYFCATGKEIPLGKDFDPTKIVQKKGNNIGSMISCVYLFMNQNDYESAYKKLKEYRFKFEEMHMMSHWFDLAVRCCSNPKQLNQIQDSLDDFDIDLTAKERIKGMILEALGENEKLIDYASALYKKTKKEIDLVNLISCYEKNRDWKNAEYYCNNWLEKFNNPIANIKIVRCLALQNRQEDCLNKVCEIRNSGQEECLTKEVLFYEIQALKILGKYNEAIEKGEDLWSKEVSPQVLFLLAECYYLNVQEQEAIYTLRDGIKKGIRNVQVYQMYAEYTKRSSPAECEKYVKKALIQSDNDPNVMMWAMNLLYSIGKSDSASELLVKLQSLDKVDCFKTLTFKEAKELMDKAEEETKKRYEMYMNCKFPYHLFFDQSGNASYTLYCHQLWRNNIDSSIRKQLLLTTYGGHRASVEEIKKTMGQAITVDFSSLIHMKHFDILDDVKSCWNKIIISGNISNIIASEQNKCSPNQPDVLYAKKKMVDVWKRRTLNYIELPSQNDLKKWYETGISMGDIAPYELAKINNLVLVSDNFISDLLEESYKITDEMRNSVISTYELLTILEKRGDINSEFKNKYRGDRKTRKESELIDTLVDYDGKIPILVDENFLREIYEMDGVSIISQKCNVYTNSNIFYNIENEMEQVKVAREAYVFLEALKNDIKDYKESGNIGYYGFYENDNKRKRGILTNDFMDLFYHASLNKHILVCDDRWTGSYSNLGDCLIYSVVDIVEMLHEQRVISDEKYINIITQMFSEGYAYIVPPFEYVKLLLEQVSDGKEVSQEIPEELSIMCDYLVYITASESKLNDEILHQGLLPESVGYMNNLQRVLIKLMKYVWCTERSGLWKCQVSDWLLANYSVFSYRSVMNESVGSNNHKYYELELSNMLFLGFSEIPGNLYRKQYYSWLFNWFSKNSQWKNGLEDRVIQSLVDIICEVDRHEKDSPYNDIGIGILVLSGTDDMPEYYRELIRKNASIAQIIDRFEDNYVYLGEKEFITLKDFNKWLEDAIKHGINCSIIRTDEITKRNYTITFIVNELFHQGFKLEYIDNTKNKRIHYFRIDKAMLCSQETLLRTKGLLDLSDYITDSDMKKYQICLNRDNWEETTEKIVSGIKAREDYIVYIIRYMLENEIKMFSIEDLFPNSTELYENVLANNSEDDVFTRANQWQQNRDKTVVNIFRQLIIFIYNALRKSEIYSDFAEKDSFVVANYFADIVLTQITQSKESKGIKYTLQELSDWLLQLNDSKGFIDNFNNNALSQEERDVIEQEITEYFSSTDVQHAGGSQIVSICEKMCFFEGKDLQTYLSLIKEWIIEHCKTEKEGLDEENNLLRVMVYFAYIVNKEKPDQIIDSFLDLWEEILNQGIHIELSRSSMYILRGYITSFSFSQGIRMRKIVERISLQMAINEN